MKDRFDAVALEARAATVASSFAALFLEPRDGRMTPRDISAKEFAECLMALLEAVAAELATAKDDPEAAAARLRRRPTGRAPDSIDLAHQLHELSEGAPAGTLNASMLDLAGIFGVGTQLDQRLLRFFLAHANRVRNDALRLPGDYFRFLATRLDAADAPTPPRLRPDVLAALVGAGRPFSLSGGKTAIDFVARLEEDAGQSDPFAKDKAFRFAEGKFIPARLDDIRPVDHFYGFRAVRDSFHRFFENFAAGRENLPLLITSLPGLGKTQMTIAHCRHFPNITLVLPEPEALESGLERLVRLLSRRARRQFVLFFDDVDARKVDWYNFRTQVGGAFSPPPNVAIVVASNYEFPANIASRGRGVYFPVFDEVACQEMVLDYLKSMGMKNPDDDLVSVIAADYVEDYVRKVFEELSPRTLARYLDRYDRDPKKRQRSLDLSRRDIIAKPDSDVFLEANRKVVMRLNEGSGPNGAAAGTDKLLADPFAKL